MKLNPWQGKHALIQADTSDEVDIEGARMSGKTTLCIDSELNAVRDFPGIHCLWFRYSDTDTRTKLRPAVEEVIYARGDEQPQWDSEQLCFRWPNGSVAFMFGLKAANATARYAKMRGIGVARVYNDQSEELPADIGAELRAALRQPGFPHRITFSPNPINTTHWLARKEHGGFPEDNTFLGRRYHHLSLYDNAYNLPPESIERMERTFPIGHAKHRTMILGLRGPNVIGEPIFEDTFVRASHVRPITLDADALILEAFDFGKRNPVYMVAQRMFAGGLGFLGGIFGEGMFLEDFIPIVKRYRAQWFDGIDAKQFRTCVPSPGSGAIELNRFTNLALLRRSGFLPIYREQDANHADVALALIGQLASYMRQRWKKEECFAINSADTHWLRASREGIGPDPFFAHACEASAVWSEHWASVSHQKHSQIHEDDEASNALRAALNIELNFCANLPTGHDLEKRRQRDYDWSRDNQQLARSAASWMGF